MASAAASARLMFADSAKRETGNEELDFTPAHHDNRVARHRYSQTRFIWRDNRRDARVAPFRDITPR